MRARTAPRASTFKRVEKQPTTRGFRPSWTTSLRIGDLVACADFGRASLPGADIPILRDVLKLSPTERRQLLARAPLFRGIDSSRLDNLVPATRVESFGAQKNLFRKGDRGRQLYVVARGRLKALTTSDEGDEVVFGIMGPGEVIGEIGILGDTERTLTVRTLEPCDLLVLDGRDFLSLVRTEPDLCLELLQLLGKRIRDQIQMFEDVKFLKLPYRLARKLDNLAEIYGEPCDGGIRIDLKLSQEEWGDTVGATREAVNKQLRSWVDEGLIRIDHGYIVLCDPERIKALAENFPL